MNSKKKILILNGQYAPGYKGGGPIQSCINMVENLCEDFDFYVLCADRDYKEKVPYENILVNQWNVVGNAQVYYMSEDSLGLKGFERILNDTDYDVIYLNGFFSPIFTIRPLLLRRLGRLKKKPIILSPRGDFTGGCENKKLKKYTYIGVAKLIGLYKDLLWHATSAIEARDIEKKFHGAKIATIPNLSAKFVPKGVTVPKEQGELRLVFVSRIFPKKNLKFALEVLSKVQTGHVIYDIYGPMEDTAYWAECNEIIRRMPKNIEVRYCGEASHNDIPKIFAQYHAFFFPTLGENYGHVIVEAMMNNCLCIMSRGVTPWDEYLDYLKLGADLSKPKDFVDIIERMVAASGSDIARMLEYNNTFIAEHTDASSMLPAYCEMLNR